MKKKIQMKEIIDDYVRLFTCHLPDEPVPNDAKFVVLTITLVLLLAAFLSPLFA